MNVSSHSSFQPSVASSLGSALGSAVSNSLTTPAQTPPASQTTQAQPQSETQAQTPTNQTAATPPVQTPAQNPTQGGPDQHQTVFVQMPQGLSLNPGTTMYAQVAAQDDGGGFLLQMGENLVPAQTDSPLQVGQSIQLQVQANDNGVTQLQLVDTPLSQMQTGELAENLADLNLPVTESSLQLAQAMVEHGLPLTGESFTTMLSQTSLPPGSAQVPVDAKVSAAVFMQQNQIPVTAGNMNLLSNFFAANPNLGEQMLAVNGALQKLQKTLDKGSNDLLNELPALLGAEGVEEMGGGGQPAQPQTPPKLYNMAKQAGIESNWSNFYGGDDDKPDIATALRQMREQMTEQGESGELMGLMQDIEHNLDAQKLINRAVPPQDIGFYYLQIPFSFHTADGAQVWVRYERRDNGKRDVDPDDSRVEFLVTTENMGNLFFVLELRDGAVAVEVNTEYDDVREFVEAYLPALKETIEKLGWNVMRVLMGHEARPVGREFVERTSFAAVQHCNVNA